MKKMEIKPVKINVKNESVYNTKNYVDTNTCSSLILSKQNNSFLYLNLINFYQKNYLNDFRMIVKKINIKTI